MLSPWAQSTEVAGALTKTNLSYFNYDPLLSLSRFPSLSHMLHGQGTVGFLPLRIN